jgi:multiple sugar transport system ATP-binding protein
MNLYRAAISLSADEPTMQLGSQRLSLPPELFDRVPDLRAYGDREVIVGIRPEHFVVPDGPVDAGRAVLADVDLVEPLGNEVLVHVSIDAPRIREESEAVGDDGADTGIAGASRAEGAARADPRAGVRSGTRTTFALDTGRLHFFDGDTFESLERVAPWTDTRERARL